MTRHAFRRVAALGFVVVVSVAWGQDVAVVADGVLYDTQKGQLVVPLKFGRAERLAPLRVSAACEQWGFSAEREVASTAGEGAECRLPWPHAPLGSRVTITVRPREGARETDGANNTCVVAMDVAVGRYMHSLPEPLPSAKPGDLPKGRTWVYEVEDFPTQTGVSVEEAKGASAGRAVRLHDARSRAEREVVLEAGTYYFYAVAMAFAGNQDALNVALAGTKQRGHLSGYDKWIPQDHAGVVRVPKGTYKLIVYYDEPKVLVDKVVVVQGK